MNIAIVLDAIGKQVGGSFFSTLRFADLLKKRGHKIIFIAAKYPDTPYIDYYNGMKIYRFLSVKLPKTENQFYIGFPTKKQIKKIFEEEKIDILHVMIPTPASLPAIKAAEEMRIKIVAHSHTQPENVFLHLPELLRSSKIDHFFYKYLIWVYKKAEIIICPSKFAENLLKKYDKNLKTVVVSNGVSFSKFKKTNTGNFFKKYKLNHQNKRILFVGRLHPEKSVHTLIEAMPTILEQFNDVHLDIIGIGHLRESLESLSNSLGLKNNVTFFGKAPDKDLIDAYNSADIFCLPSLAELEGMVVLEAMACGKPLLISNSENSASKYFVKDNGYLFKPEDSKDLAIKAIKILSNKKLKDNMAKRSYEMAKEYNINNCVLKIEKIYKSI